MNPVQRRIYEATCRTYDFRSVLDVGCGLGIGTALLAQRADYAHGVDISERSIQFARSTYSCLGKIKFSTLDILKDPISGAYDLVVAVEVIEHLSDYELFLDRLRLLCAPQTTLILSTPNRNNPARDTIRPAVTRHVREFRSQELWLQLQRRFKPRRMLDADMKTELDPMTASCTPVVVECGV